MENLQPVPTEYNGTLYRSKSEAIFARSLEISSTELFEDGSTFIRIQYEPERLKLSDNYTPDFYTSTFLTGLNLIMNTIIEYKPGPVTNEYFKKLTKRFETYADWAKNEGLVFPVGFETRINCALYCGNPFDNKEKTFQAYNCQYREWIPARAWDEAGLPDWVIKKAKEYRFDLAPVLKEKPTDLPF